MPAYGKNTGSRQGNIIKNIKAEAVFKPLLFLCRQNSARRIVFCGKIWRYLRSLKSRFVVLAAFRNII